MGQLSGLEIYKASAGSGKTFQLTLQYLLLALRSPQAFTQIQAVTFTNKATAEMKHRIITVLAALAKGSESGKSYAEKILAAYPDVNEAQLRQRADDVYRHILHNFSKFSITTIDAFVQKIIRSFSWELGIDNGYELVLNTEPVKQDLGDRLIKRLDTDANLRRWIEDLARQRLQDGKNWNFRSDMIDLASQLFKESFEPFEEFARIHQAELSDRFKALQNKIYETIERTNQKWMQQADRFIQLVSENGLEATDFHHGNNGFYNWVKKVSRLGAQAPSKRLVEAVDEGKIAAKKKNNTALVESLAPQISATLQPFLEWATQDLKTLSTALAIKRRLDLLRLIAVMVEELANYRQENNAILISDTHKLLRQLTLDTPAPFIYEKTGNRFHTYLIDEFQDTSGFQWDNFRPLLEESLGSGYYNLVVGDIKQAIYRWRNGDFRLLLHQVQDQLRAFAPTNEVLHQNFRSTQQVIAINNFLFTNLPGLLQDISRQNFGLLEVDVQQWLQQSIYANVFSTAYADAAQQIPESATNQGFVRVRWLKKEGGEAHINNEDADEETETDHEPLNYLYQQVQELLQQGFRPGQLGILVRKNKEAAQVVEYLLQAQSSHAESLPFRIVSGEGLLLKNNPAIDCLICCLRLAASAGKDSIALAQIRSSYARLAGLPLNRHNVFAPKTEDALWPVDVLALVQKNDSLNLVDFIHEMVMALQLAQFAHAQAYLPAFYDIIHDFSKKGKAMASEFLQFWDEESDSFSLPESWPIKNAV